MAKILKNPEKLKDRVIVEYSPEEILPKDLYVSLVDHEKPQSVGQKIGNAIQTAAWRDLCMHAPQVVDKGDLKYGNVQVIDGQFVVTFFREAPQTPAPPGGKDD